MRKDKRKSCEPKGIYRVRNWSEYNAGLIAQGSLTMWIDESAFMRGREARHVKRGRPQVYSDALMTHQDIDDASALSGLLAQTPADEPIDTIGGDGAYDTKQCHKVTAGRGATPSIPPRDGEKPWSEGKPGASWRNEAIDDIARDGRGEWKKHSGDHQRSLIENAMYRYKTLTGNCLSARYIGSQATEVAIRVGVVNHMVILARPQSVRIS
jgi:hypothetical protein